MYLSGMQKGSEDGIMQVGDLVMLKQEMFDDRLLGILIGHSLLAAKVMWSNGTESFHPQRHLEVVCSK